MDKKEKIFFLCVALNISSGLVAKHWDYSGFPGRRAEPAFDRVFVDSPASNMEVGPFVRTHF